MVAYNEYTASAKEKVTESNFNNINKALVLEFMNCELDSSKLIFNNINSKSATGPLLNRHDATCKLVSAAARNITESCYSLNEVTYKENLLLLTNCLNDLMNINDGFTMHSTFTKKKS